ncbi:hypothetical protein [Hydrogenophaga sp. MI9]|uniref:hypothetical protein n=1 Tax=Hydrogenophaga sp. MI9 TaxID=3453719 RepID=UPI003EEEC89F
MSEVVKHLNDAERASLGAQVETLARAPAPRVDARSGEQFVFVAHFDGTNNDKDDLKRSGNPLPTNVAELWSQMKPLETGNHNFKTHYYRGVGTDPGAKGVADALAPTAEMKDTAHKAYQHFEREASEWLRAHPEASPADSLKVMATAFSRGGGTAAVFSQLLYERGLSDPKTGKTLAPPGQLGLVGAMVYDPVTTGYDGNSAFSPTSKNITVVRAQNEYREWFKGVDHTRHPGATTVEVVGNHCNIGGGHDHGIAARVLEASTEWFKKSGLPIADVRAQSRYDGRATIYHERDIPYTNDVSRVSRSPVARVVSPLGSVVVDAAARAADYPVTHDPRQGLDAKRQLAPTALEEVTRKSDGWKLFHSASGAVWRKTYPGDGGQSVTAVMVERREQGPPPGQIDFHLMQDDGQGHTKNLLRRTLPPTSGEHLRHSLDQRLTPPAYPEPMRVQEGARAAAHPNADQRATAEQFKEQLGPRLQQLGMSEKQVKTLAAASVALQTQHANQGKASAFRLSKDASTIAMQQERPPLREIQVVHALGQAEQSHWQTAAQAMTTAKAVEPQTGMVSATAPSRKQSATRVA